MTEDRGQQAGDQGGGASGAGAGVNPLVKPVAGSPDGPRLCGFSLCRKVLPDAGTGRKLEFCRDSDTSWPVGDRTASCRELGRAERALAAVTDARAAVAEVNVVELGEAVDAVLGPVRAIAGPVAALLDTLTGVRTQLDDAVATARADREEALRLVAEANGRVEAAEQVAAEERAARQSADQRAEAAEREGRRDREAKERAMSDTRRAEGQVLELQNAQRRDAERIQALIERVETAETQLATRTSERNSARAEWATEKQRADDAEAANLTLERALRDEFLQALERRAEQHQQNLDEVRAAFDARLDQIRADLEAARETERRQHTEQLGTLQQQIGALTTRAETTENSQRAQLDRNRALRTVLAAAHGRLGDDDAELRDQIQQLLAGA
ncbi:hypothetical protein C8D87_11412 [Lentzea atacamensis]|uniref:Chromosome segregation ATPase n=1 Tax=Lentzea atacamensis TaxID=531938 RepID=A0ABX9DVT1_9PSEU|nr:hypothetical protein [Lentzea atacamensis]RAS59400.1 hypothetical protein C8D87_11412 [Lentzea atacamensis]